MNTKNKVLSLSLCAAFGAAFVLSSAVLPSVPAVFAETNSLQTAIDGAQSGETVKLTENCAEAVTVAEDDNIVLDLNGFEISATLTNNGTLKIVDSVETGAFRLMSNTSGVVSAIVNNGDLTFDGATVEATGTGNQTDIRGITNNSGATVSFLSGDISVISSGGYFGNAIFNAAGGTVEEISGGTLSAQISNTNVKLNSVAINNSGTIKDISGGKITSENNGNGGTGNYAVAIRNNNGGVIESISGGELYGCTDNGSEVAYAIFNQSGATVKEISGGKLTGETKEGGIEWAFGIRNDGNIQLISGGQIVARISHTSSSGGPNAIALCNDGMVGNVTGGTFFAASSSVNGGTYAIRTRAEGHSITISGGAYDVGKGTEFIRNESPAVTNYAQGYSLSAASRNGYAYAIPDGGRYEENVEAGTAATYDASDELLKEYALVDVNGSAASIGSDGYATIAQAIAAAEAGDTVTVERDTTGFTVPEGKDVTVDLNGCEVTGSVVNNGKLKIVDSVGTGRLYKSTSAEGPDPLITNNGTFVWNAAGRIDGKGNSTQANGIDNNVGAVLTVEGGLLRSFSFGTCWSHTIVNDGTATVNGGMLETMAFNAGNASNIICISNAGSGVCTINGGTVYAQSTGIKAGDLERSATGVRTQGTSSLTVNGGTVRAVSTVADSNQAVLEAFGINNEATGSSVTVNGGSVEAVAYNDFAFGIRGAGTVTVTGGKISAYADHERGAPNLIGLAMFSGTANVSGGYFKAYSLTPKGITAGIRANVGSTVNVSGGAFEINKLAETNFVLANDGTVNYEDQTSLRKMQAETVRYAAAENDVIVEQLDGTAFAGVDVLRGGETLYSYHAAVNGNRVADGYAMEDGTILKQEDLAALTQSATVQVNYTDAPVYYFLGSSVTYGHANNGSSFVNEIQNLLRCVCVKEAVSGTTLANNGSNSYVARMLGNLDKNAKVDTLIVQLSTNDVSQNVARGAISDTKNLEDIDNTTTLGAIEYIIAYAKKTWDCKVVFYTNPDYNNAQYESLVKDLYEIQEKWGIGIVDFYYYVDMDRLDAQTLASYMADAIHPNAKGYRWMGEVFAQYLSK